MGNPIRNRIPSTGRGSNSPPYVDLPVTTAGAETYVALVSAASSPGTYQQGGVWVGYLVPGGALTQQQMSGITVGVAADGSLLLGGASIEGGAAAGQSIIRAVRVA